MKVALFAGKKMPTKLTKLYDVPVVEGVFVSCVTIGFGSQLLFHKITIITTIGQHFFVLSSRAPYVENPSSKFAWMTLLR